MSMLDVQRETELLRINENPITYTVTVYPTRVNRAGETVEDRTEESTGTIEVGPVRVCRKSSGIVTQVGAETPLANTETFYLLAAYDNEDLAENQEFTTNGFTFRTKHVEPKKSFGGVTHKVCDLEDITERSLV